MNKARLIFGTVAMIIITTVVVEHPGWFGLSGRLDIRALWITQMLSSWITFLSMILLCFGGFYLLIGIMIPMHKTKTLRKHPVIIGFALAASIVSHIMLSSYIVYVVINNGGFGIGAAVSVAGTILIYQLSERQLSPLPSAPRKRLS